MNAVRLALICATSLVGSSLSGTIRADESAPSSSSAPSSPSTKTDTTYGRIGGYVGLVFGAGATFGPRSPRGTLDFRARYLETTGLFLTYEEGAVFGSGAEPKRVLAGGLEIRPLFVARWLTGREFGNPRADLMLDSLGLELGGYISQPQGQSFGGHPGFQAGLGLEVPVFPRVNGLWVGFHGGVRWSEAALGGEAISGPADRAMYLSITLAWHAIVADKAVDMEHVRPVIDLRGALARALLRVDVRTRTRDALIGQRPHRVLAVGKAASAMIDGAFEACGATIQAALVVLPDDSPTPRDDAGARVMRASHPLPDARSLAAGEAALAFGADLALVSGGTSSLIFVPIDTLENARAAVAALLASGASVQEINTVRRHASRAHGGRLGAMSTFLVSDVLGRSPSDIGSGPTVEDPSTVSDAREILDRYAPAHATLRLEESRKGASPGQRVAIIAAPDTFARAVASELAALGVRATVSDGTNDDVAVLARRYVARAGSLGAGEAIVCAAEPRLQIDVPEPGAGGRCTHLAALVARDLPPGVTFAAVASDGVDGGSGTSGAIVTSDSFLDRAALDGAIAAFDTGSLHRARGTALSPGPTGANLADLHVLIRPNLSPPID